MKAPVFDPAWSDEVKHVYRHDMQEIWDSSICVHIWNVYHNQLDMYVGIADDFACGKKLKILDAGCAQATLAMHLAEQGHKVTAVDLREPFLDYAKTRYTHGDIRFIAGNALEMNLDEQFDIVFATQIIEHLVYPQDFVSRLSGLLRPGGRLVITTPNWHYLRNNLPTFTQLGDVTQHEHKQFTADDDGHFFAYTGSELRQVFAGAGLENVAVRYYETPFISGHMKFRYMHYAVSRRILSYFDRAVLALPWLGRLLAFQILITGDKR
jgi:2-polyprenyl-3-methyl-5-hydroxy-6-metoxy-1,4-benzoquinol methylase